VVAVMPKKAKEKKEEKAVPPPVAPPEKKKKKKKVAAQPPPEPPPASTSTSTSAAGNKRKAESENGSPAKKRKAPKPTGAKKEKAPKPPGTKESKHKGVSWIQKVEKWQASIWLQPTQLEDEDAKKGRTVFLGYWETEQKALDIYQEALKAREAGKPLPKHLLRTKTLTSKHFGVSLVKRTGKFTAAIRCDGKQHYVGTYTNEDDAKKAYDRAAEQIKETVRADQIICRSIPVACSPRRVLLTVPGCRDRASSRATRNRRSRSTVA
jgi:hypothetical protein